MAIRKEEQSVINAFVRAQERMIGIEWKIIEWPDANPRAVNEIDAVASRSNTLVAIEHMSIDAIENQRRDSNYFSKAMGDLEKELQGLLPFSLRITIPYEAITRGHDWDKTRERLKSWILNEVIKLPDIKKRFYPEGLHFSVYISKDSTHHGNIILSRSVIEEDFSMHDVTIKCLRRHSDKLLKYKNKHYETILLIESFDIALMNPVVAKSIITRAADQDALHGINRIWYADTSGNTEIYFSTITPHCKNETQYCFTKDY